MDDFAEFQRFSVFNMSVATLQRIDALLSGLNGAYMTGDVVLFSRGLMALYSELDPFLDDKDRFVAQKNYLEKIKADPLMLAEKGQIVGSSSAFALLIDFNWWQRRKLNDKGLLMSRGDDPGRAMG